MPKKHVHKPKLKNLPVMEYSSIESIKNTVINSIDVEFTGDYYIALYDINRGSTNDRLILIRNNNNKAMARHMYNMFRHRFKEVKDLLADLRRDMEIEAKFCEDNKHVIAKRIALKGIQDKAKEKIVEAHS